MYQMQLVNQAILSEKRAAIEEHKSGNERFELNPAFTFACSSPRKTCRRVLELNYSLNKEYQPVYCNYASDCIYAS